MQNAAIEAIVPSVAVLSVRIGPGQILLCHDKGGVVGLTQKAQLKYHWQGCDQHSLDYFADSNGGMWMDQDCCGDPVRELELRLPNGRACFVPGG